MNSILEVPGHHFIRVKGENTTYESGILTTLNLTFVYELLDGSGLGVNGRVIGETVELPATRDFVGFEVSGTGGELLSIRRDFQSANIAASEKEKT